MNLKKFPKNIRLKLLSPSKDAASRFMQSDDVEFITNDTLCCARCVHLWPDKTVECEIFEQKPLSVLRGGDCADLAER